jgi:2-keto-3-deoxy-6-phosphogluconate aldolase
MVKKEVGHCIVKTLAWDGMACSEITKDKEGNFYYTEICPTGKMTHERISKERASELMNQSQEETYQDDD